jgi:hypothetical protein
VRCGGFLSGGSGFHPFYIGVAGAELQAKLRGCYLPEKIKDAANGLVSKGFSTGDMQECNTFAQ